ncbi:Lipopolysaccharide biosynthesis regulator YciM, contains six TPR domains and a predicted metal-binding C-terminal domain [Modicisalibacter ilicicola DSM 19980]|uniref:Lipopolysaccharide assembly protein B n=1 Tax=Modicisalibacter ilicicola DSM 19980 TaxID=1121942 RepID=A0A1M4ZE59_9GAMM|nr:lipopolysaccharide assembly protein LapB [Halomonas ilicicola]SHF16343.1 Lipopolysaccharide biosynthesis regulator YciM, contains six TPR domains and a predicted metal-binding C-terminal domain [Halomonas ilicicola DSM 19980]
MPDLLLLALLVAAIAIGWWLGRRQRDPLEPRPRQQTSLSRDYFTGLNYLLNEQPDRAIETFVQVLEVDSDTIETHIALGNLFRSRGEADRAVRIHQNLLARPALSVAQSDQVQLELSRDFLNLGVLDRAERLLQQLIRDTRDEAMRRSAKRLLVDLFEREREWQQALDVALPRLVQQEADIRRAAAHWLCELAHQHMNGASPSLARKRLRQALATDASCIRANWLLATIEREAGNYKAEIRALRRIPEQDRSFTPIILEPLRNAYLKLEDEEALEQCLRELDEATPFTCAVIMLAQALERREGIAAAAEFAGTRLNANPSLRGIDYLMDLYLLDSDVAQHEHIVVVKQHITKLLEARPRFRCHRCGFSGMQLHWQCPRCRSWGAIKPINGLEGE